MADINISGLNARSAVAATDLFEVETGDSPPASEKATAAQIAAYVASTLGGGGSATVLFGGKIAVSQNGTVLTAAVKTTAGADPSAGSPVKVYVPDGAGGITELSITAALSLAISSGSTLGFAATGAARIWWGILNNGGAAELLAVNVKTATAILAPVEGHLVTTTAEGGAGGADSAGVPYSASARADKYFAFVGYSTWTTVPGTPGTWNADPATTTLCGFGTKRPGDVARVSRVVKSDTYSQGSPSAGTWYAPTGFTISPSIVSTANLIHLTGFANIGGGSVTGYNIRVKRDSTVIEAGDAASSRSPVHASGSLGAAGIDVQSIPINAFDFAPGATPAYSVEIMTGSTGALQFNRSATDSDAASNPRARSVIYVTELMA